MNGRNAGSTHNGARNQPRISGSSSSACFMRMIMKVSMPMVILLRGARSFAPQRYWNYSKLRSLSSKKSTANNQDDPSSILLNSVQQTLQQEILVSALSQKGGRVDYSQVAVTMVLGVSGGCDSVALLHALNQVLLHQPNSADKEQTVGTWNLHVAHFDHQQRGAESDRDREFVQSLCTEMQLPFHCYFWNDQDHTSSFSQDSARQWRRLSMRQLLLDQIKVQQRNNNVSIKRHQQRIGLLVTAHHKDDSDETMLLKLLRGVHITNVSGLPVVQPDDSAESSSSLSSAMVPIYWARPLIHLRKTQIVSYLHDNEYPWREDASNQTDKYKRNRVRNELIPLLQDLMDGPQNLEQRLENLEQQSREIRNDIKDRAQQYLNKHTSSLHDQSLFFIPNQSHCESFDLVAKEALHQWVVKQSGASFGYDQLQRLLQQLENFPHRLQWRLNIGDGWDVQREGETLRLVRTQDGGAVIEEVRSPPPVISELDWIPASELPDEPPANTSSTIFVRISEAPDSSLPRFLQSTVSDNKFRITPSWRPHSKPIKMSSFLRGQGVPLHLRRETPVVTCQRKDGTASLVAVFISNKDEWIVDAAFADDLESNEDLKRIALLLNCDK